MTEPEAESWRRRAKVLSRKSADDRDPDERDPDERKSVSPSQAEETSQPVPTDPEPEQPAPDQWQALDALTAFEAAMEESGEAGLRRQKRFSWVEWSGLVAVAGLLIAAMVMWYQRPTGLAPTTKVDDAVNMPPDRQRPAEPSGQSKRDPTAASAKDRSMPDSGNRQRAVQIADRVLDDAGDGSFALENSGENGIEMNIANSPADAKPPSDSELNSSTESTANPGPKKKPRVYARAPDPKSIQPLARPVIACEAEQPLRKQLELLPRTRAFISFDRIYPIAFEAHQNYLAIKSADSDSEEIESELVKCIGLFEQCLDRPANEFTDEQHQQIAYTLAKLYFDAGHLYESAVYAMAVARSADSTQPIANSAVTLAFAALQEAHLAHYGAPSLPGELRQMERLCDLVSSRGLKHPQLDAMRFATAQRFDQAGMHVKAAQIFTQIAKSSPLFAKAQLAAGRSFWSEAMIRERDGIKSQLEAIVSSAAKYLGIAIDEANDDESATPSFLAGQFALAEIALRRDDPDTAIELL
ncbi:MAG: hypothetical protein KDB00_24660, partial [Planctomycetales bacterium]|nr:hypothetical protein [Planctomycetales bacterium]